MAAPLSAKKRRMFAFGAGLLSLLLLGVVAEIGLRFTLKAPPFPGLLFSSELKAEMSSGPQNSPELIRWSSPRLTGTQVQAPPRGSKLTQLIASGSGFWSFKVGINPYPKPGSAGRARLELTNGELIYDVAYEFDERGRRYTGPVETSKIPALFLGCSFTLGEGVNGSETFAAQFGKHAPKFQPYIMAFHGWGPNNLLSVTQARDYTSDIKASQNSTEGIAIYTYIDDHLNRVIGASNLTETFHWSGLLPAYHLEDGKPKTEGSLKDVHPWQMQLMSFYRHSFLRSYLFTSFFPELPILRPSHFDLMAAILEELKQEVRQQSGISRFIVLFYPSHGWLAPWLIPRLHARGIETIDWSKTDLDQYVNPSRIPYDGHPSKEAHAIIGQELARELMRPQAQ